jgi:Orange carotenoid protein, N-terminal
MTNTTNIQEHTGEIVDQILEGELPENIRSEGVQSATKAFDNLETDVQLAVLYYLYEAMGESVTPAAPGAAGVELSQSFFDEFKSSFVKSLASGQKSCPELISAPAICNEYFGAKSLSALDF